ncbi:MAG: type II toxin-antitoxin system Phd/YefM family antitoxin [Rubrobacter sp.]|nr:type II toxin-antitoxin system Phd/YefM family antitoxin [Rubrobacter sp.]
MEATERQMNSGEARNALPELLARAAYGHEHTVIARRGKPMAALISMEELRLFEQLLEEYRDRADSEAADQVMTDEADEIVPFKRTTERTS